PRPHTGGARGAGSALRGPEGPQAQKHGGRGPGPASGRPGLCLCYERAEALDRLVEVVAPQLLSRVAPMISHRAVRDVELVRDRFRAPAEALVEQALALGGGEIGQR